MKLKQKDYYVSEELKRLATSKIFFWVIICEIIWISSTLFKLFVPEIYPVFSNNEIVNTVLSVITVLCSSLYGIFNIICYVNIYSYFKGKDKKLFGLKYIYKVQVLGIFLPLGCMILFPAIGNEFNLLHFGVYIFLYTSMAMIMYLIYSKLIKNAIECAEFAANGFFRGKIGNGIIIYMMIILVSQVYSVISSPIFKFSQYASLFQWIKIAIAGLPSIISLVSLILYFILLFRFKRAMDIK